MNPPLSFTDGFAHIIDGKKVTSAVAPTPATHTGVVNPATGAVFAHVPRATREQLDDAVAAAERAFPAWDATPWTARQRVLESIAGVLETHAAHFVPLLMEELGKDQTSVIFEVSLAPQYLRAFARESLEDEIVSEDAQRIVKNRFRPYGVCGAIITFNFPLVLTIIKMGQALLAGNCLIIKSPPTAPCTVARFVEVCQAFVPPGVLSVLHGGNEVGEWIVQHPRILRVSMTGSTAGGKAVMRAAADELKSVTLELGGNDPCIVLDDVAPAEIAQRILLGTVSNAGQTCFQMKRVYVHDAVYDAVRDAFVALAREVKVGNPRDPEVKLGPVQNARQYERLRGILAECKEKGYKIAYEGDTPADSNGYFIPLTIVDNPPDDARLVREEQFGPIVPLLRWSDDEDVVRRANDTEYGLGASIWGYDGARMERIGDRLCAGMVWMNEWGAVGGELPMQGMKHSGVGVESSKHGLAAWTVVQSVVRNNSL